MLRSFRLGLTTGIVLQLAVGPVFLFVMNLALQRSFLSGLAGAFAAMTADAIYMALAITGIGKVLERQGLKKPFGIASSSILILFGILLIEGARHVSYSTSTEIQGSTHLISSYASVFLLTITNPLTILFYGGIFAAKAIEHRFNTQELIAFGVGTALATPLFMGTCAGILVVIRGVLPPLIMQALNVGVGILLIGYGLKRMIATVYPSRTKT